MMYRAYWAIPRTMKTSAGEQVNTVFGMASMLLAILKQEEPDALLICFDEGDETFRHQENETYKEGRAETPDDFYVQIPRVLELIDTFGFSHVSNPQYEADDFIASYGVEGHKQGMQVTMVSGDRDLFQLVNSSIRIAIPHKGYQAVEYLDAAGVEAKLGVRPDQVASYKGLCGDSSDNLPGVHGIGPKTAAGLLQEHGSLEGIYENLESLKPKVREKLEQDRDQAFFCERMAQLELEIPLPVPMEDLALKNLPVESVFDLFGELEFTLLTKRLQSLLDTSFGVRCFNQVDIPTVEEMREKNTEDQMSLF